MDKQTEFSFSELVVKHKELLNQLNSSSADEFLEKLKVFLTDIVFEVYEELVLKKSCELSARIINTISLHYFHNVTQLLPEWQKDYLLVSTQDVLQWFYSDNDYLEQVSQSLCQDINISTKDISQDFTLNWFYTNMNCHKIAVKSDDILISTFTKYILPKLNQNTIQAYIPKCIFMAITEDNKECQKYLSNIKNINLSDSVKAQYRKLLSFDGANLKCKEIIDFDKSDIILEIINSSKKIQISTFQYYMQNEKSEFTQICNITNILSTIKEELKFDEITILDYFSFLCINGFIRVVTKEVFEATKVVGVSLQGITEEDLYWFTVVLEDVFVNKNANAIAYLDTKGLEAYTYSVLPNKLDRIYLGNVENEKKESAASIIIHGDYIVADVVQKDVVKAVVKYTEQDESKTKPKFQTVKVIVGVISSVISGLVVWGITELIMYLV